MLRLDEVIMVPTWKSIEKPELYLPEDPASATEVDGPSGRNSAGGGSYIFLTLSFLFTDLDKVNKKTIE